MKSKADQGLEEVKAGFAQDLEGVRLEANKALAEYQNQLAARSSRQARITDEIIRWTNPILDSVYSLEGRLGNILSQEGYLALSKEGQVNENWSVSYDYFMDSTLFLFSQYFCWTILLREKLNFELFETNEAKDRFFSAMEEVSGSLSSFPRSEPCSGKDMQVFRLQQRGIGEAMIVREDSSECCMRYAEFLKQRDDPALASQLAPLRSFLDGVSPTTDCRWQRLGEMRTALGELRQLCQEILRPADQPSQVARSSA